MARITSEKAAQQYGGLFNMVLGATQRAREIKNGSTPRVICDNGPIVTALKEIEEGLYTQEDYLKTIKGKNK
jgi:DNA-directed RNA polymerase subunit omega